jgi:DNA-damage-inducible protein D
VYSCLFKVDNSDEIKALFHQFEQASQSLEAIECWSARELCTLLGYLWIVD